MKSDMQIKDDVVDELFYNAAVNAANIGVTVKDGVVTLAGHVTTFGEKFAAQQAAQVVKGVKAIAIEIEVALPRSHVRGDTELAQAARQALGWNTQIPEEDIAIVVEDGWIFLSGEAQWAYQREQAAHAVRYLQGVRGLSNRIELKHQVSSDNVEHEIESALKRQAEREAHRISIDVNNGIVTLSGKVRSIAEERAAVGAAFNAKGVRKVISELEVVLA